MGRSEISGEQVIDESIETQDIKDKTILLEDLSQEVLNEMGGTSIDTNKNGYDYNNFPKQRGVLEICLSASSGTYWRIDFDNNYDKDTETFKQSKFTGQTTFGNGTPLSDNKLIQYPATGETYFSFYVKGVLMQKTFHEYNLTYGQGFFLLGYDENGDLCQCTTEEEAILETALTVLIVLHSVDNNKIIFANERHGCEMSRQTHFFQHTTEGAEYSKGLQISGLINNGNTFNSITSGRFWDEDIAHHINIALIAPFMYKSGTNGEWKTTDFWGDISNALGLRDGDGDVVYNENDNGDWKRSKIGNDYIVTHFFATNDIEYPIRKIVGQKLYGSRSVARKRAADEINQIVLDGLPTPEFVYLYSCIIHKEDKGQIEVGIDGQIYTDYRKGYPSEIF